MIKKSEMERNDTVQLRVFKWRAMVFWGKKLYLYAVNVGFRFGLSPFPKYGYICVFVCECVKMCRFIHQSFSTAKSVPFGWHLIIYARFKNSLH